MKTLTKGGVSLYLLDDAEVISITSENITVGEPAKFIIADCNSGNITLHEGVTAPADWSGWKYLFNGTDWTQNPDWIDPATVEEPIV